MASLFCAFRKTFRNRNPAAFRLPVQKGRLNCSGRYDVHWTRADTHRDGAILAVIGRIYLRLNKMKLRAGIEAEPDVSCYAPMRIRYSLRFFGSALSRQVSGRIYPAPTEGVRLISVYRFERHHRCHSETAKNDTGVAVVMTVSEAIGLRTGRKYFFKIVTILK